MQTSPHGVSFRSYNTPRLAVPVKNTFIDFGEPPPTPTHERSASCPPSLLPCSCVDGASSWEGATQALSHAMAPVVETRSPGDGSRDTRGASPQRDRAVPVEAEVEAVRADGNAGAPSSSSSSWALSGELPGVRQADSTGEGGNGCTGEAEAEGTASSASSESDGAPPDRRRRPRPQALLAQVARPLAALAPLALARHASPQNTFGRMASGWETRHYRVGIDEGHNCQAVRRAFGPSGEHLQRLVSRSLGAKVWLRGRGAPPAAGPEQEEPRSPLEVCVGAAPGPGLERAARLVEEFLVKVRDECGAASVTEPAAQVQDRGLGAEERLDAAGCEQVRPFAANVDVLRIKADVQGVEYTRGHM